MIGLQELTSRKSLSWLEFADVIFAEPVTAGNTSAFAGYYDSACGFNYACTYNVHVGSL